jgi:hypothetical protein
LRGINLKAIYRRSGPCSRISRTYQLPFVYRIVFDFNIILYRHHKITQLLNCFHFLQPKFKDIDHNFLAYELLMMDARAFAISLSTGVPEIKIPIKSVHFPMKVAHMSSS